jgi:hypothetical protein
MMKAIKTGTKKQATADRREQKKQDQERTRAAISNMFGNSMDQLKSLKIKEQGVAEGWKDLAVGGAMALGALGAGHAQAADLSNYNTQYLQQVVSGENQRPLVNIDDAKAELQARANGKQQSVTTPAKSEEPKGFSKEYLQKASDPNRFGRYLISVEKAQELLSKMQEGVAEGRLDEFAPGDDEEKTLLFYARTWYNGDLSTQQQVEKILDRMGWEIGELESKEGGAFVVQAGDINGDSYIGFAPEDLTGGQLDEIKKGQKDSNGYTRCWPGKHAEGTKKGKNGGQVRRCVPNKSVAESSLKDKIDRLQRQLLEMKLAVSLAKKTPL